MSGGIAMTGKKGMNKYPAGIRWSAVERIRDGESQCALSREYGVSPYAIRTLVPDTIRLALKWQKKSRRRVAAPQRPRVSIHFHGGFQPDQSIWHFTIHVKTRKQL